MEGVGGVARPERTARAVGAGIPARRRMTPRWRYSIPARWIESLHVPVPGWGDRVLRYQDLVALAERLASAY
jgi:hypothetical protein